MNGWRLALGLLTIIPCGNLPPVTRSMARVAMLTAPLIAVLIAIPAALTGQAGHWLGLPEFASGLVVVATMAVVTRGMHIDGLADTIDGLGASWDRERAIQIMKTGDVGPMGAIGIVVTTGLQAAAAGALLAQPGGWLLVVAGYAAARAACSIVCHRCVWALSTSGLGAQVARSTSTLDVVSQWIVTVAVVIGAAIVTGMPPWQPLAVAAGVGGGVVLLVVHCRRRLGGINGDVIGASVEVAATLWLCGLVMG